MSLLPSLENILGRADLPETLHNEVAEIIAQLKKHNRRLEFAMQRLQQDKVVTEDFLNTTILELEEANKELKEYQKRELQEKEETIRFQESQLKQITDAMPSSIAFVDADFRYQFNNKSYTEWFGKEENELRGVHVSEVIGKQGFEIAGPFLRKTIRGEKHEFENILTGKEGKDIVIYTTFVPAYDNNKNIIGVYVYGQDITSLKEKENAIAAKNAELKKYIESNLQLENFAYLASHDLQSPLANVRNFSKLLSQTASDRLTEKEKKFLEFIDEGSARMQQFIKDLLAYSVASNKSIDFEDINMNTVISEVLTDISATVKNNKAHIQVDPLPSNFYGDKVLLKQLFLNLITNAIKFIPPGTTPEVYIRYRKDTNNHVFCVKDNGIGIAKEAQEKIFAIFQRLHLRNEYEGTGIGLSTCKNAVEKHGGKIWVESEEGNGSTFVVEIPVYSVEFRV